MYFAATLGSVSGIPDQPGNAFGSNANPPGARCAEDNDLIKAEFCEYSHTLPVSWYLRRMSEATFTLVIWTPVQPAKAFALICFNPGEGVTSAFTAIFTAFRSTKALTSWVLISAVLIARFSTLPSVAFVVS